MCSNKKIVCLLLCLSLCGCQFVNTILDSGVGGGLGEARLIAIDSIATSEVNYQLWEVKPSALERRMSSQVNITHLNEQPLFFKEWGGRLKAIYVALNQSVKEGDLLAEITFDENMLNAEIQRRQIQNESDRMIFENEQERRLDSINDMRMAKMETEALLASLWGNNEESRLVQNDLQIWDVRIKKALAEHAFYSYETEYNLMQQQVEIAKLQKKLEGEQIYAPFDGIIWQVSYIPVGRYVQPDERVMTIYDPEDYVLYFQGESTNYRYNMDLNVEIRNAGTHSGRIIYNPDAPDEMEYNPYFLVQFAEKPMEYDELRNKTMTIQARTFYVDGVLTVPVRGIRNEDAKKYVFILEDGVVKKRYIQQGLVTPDSVQILSGVSEGDMIVMN